MALEGRAMSDTKADDSVTLGFIHNGHDVAYSWHRGFVELLGYDMTHGGQVIRGG